MDQEDQGNENRSSESNPLKRRRGRPRKHPRPNVSHEENVVPRFQNLQRQQNVPNSPGFNGINGNLPHQVNANGVVVGQVVHGVVDAAFDAGYLLTVKVGNSDYTLRGVVFKPGQYVPVAADNDVAPNIPMIRRNAVPVPANLNQVNVNNSRTRERNEVVSFNRSKLAVSRAKRSPPSIVPPANPIPEKLLVPVVLQPFNSSTDGTVPIRTSSDFTNSAPLDPSKGKQVQDASALNLTNQAEAVGNQVLPSAGTTHQRIPSSAPFESLLKEVINRAQDQQLNETQQNGNNMEQALCIEPLNSIVPVSPATMPKHFENFRTGKMTELLRVQIISNYMSFLIIYNVQNVLRYFLCFRLSRRTCWTTNLR